MTDDLRDRIAAALHDNLKRRAPLLTDPLGRPIGGLGLTEYDLADVALTVVQPELDQLAADRDRVARWEHHWRWVAVQAASSVTAARELHRPAMRGGVATHVCICGAPCPCPTSKALPRAPDVCDCGPDCPRNAGETAPEWTGRAAAPQPEEAAS